MSPKWIFLVCCIWLLASCALDLAENDITPTSQNSQTSSQDQTNAQNTQQNVLIKEAVAQKLINNSPDPDDPSKAPKWERSFDESHPKVEGYQYLFTTKYVCGDFSNKIHEYYHEETGIEFVLVPGGTFRMGTLPTDNDHHRDEEPPHMVTIKPFLMAKYEVTQRIWKDVMGNEPWKDEKGKKLDYLVLGEDFPAVQISWNEAKDFCTKTGLGMPSEAQWEYACRAGSLTRFYWGEDMSSDYCWHYGNAFDVENKHAREVGKKLPNAFGLYDMTGNAEEWCEDTYFKHYKEAPTDGSARKGHPQANRVFRGGGFCREDFFCRSASRYPAHRWYKDSYMGFRPIGPVVENGPMVQQ